MTNLENIKSFNDSEMAEFMSELTVHTVEKCFEKIGCVEIAKDLFTPEAKIELFNGFKEMLNDEV